MQKTKKGFTLVELVVVIAVIAILAGVLIGTFASVINRANESARMQEIKAQEIEQKADDILKKIDNSNWYGWEDFETDIVTKLTEAYRDNASNPSGATVDQVKTAIEGALAEYCKKYQDTALTAEQVKAIVENSIGSLKFEGVTEAQVRAIVSAATNNLASSQLNVSQIKSIVTAANANNLTANDVAKIVAEKVATIPTLTITDIENAVKNATTNVSTKEDIDSLKEFISALGTNDSIKVQSYNYYLEKASVPPTDLASAMSLLLENDVELTLDDETYSYVFNKNTNEIEYYKTSEIASLDSTVYDKMFVVENRTQLKDAVENGEKVVYVNNPITLNADVLDFVSVSNELIVVGSKTATITGSSATDTTHSSYYSTNKQPIFCLTEENAKLTLVGLNLVGSSDTVSAVSSLKNNTELYISNCRISNVNYAINLRNCNLPSAIPDENNITSLEENSPTANIVIKNSTISGWCALNWKHVQGMALLENCVLDATYSGDDGFAVITDEGYNNTITLNDCYLTSSFSCNFGVSIQYGAHDSKVFLNNCRYDLVSSTIFNIEDNSGTNVYGYENGTLIVQK